MAERKAVNKYYPPDWTPDQGSINKYVGQHPLRERAKKLSQGIMVIRFELPFNIWCGGCEKPLAMGKRFNAEKKKVGNYYSTPIYRFRMKCPLCDNYFEIETDPKNCEYNVMTGARRKEERWDPSATETVEMTDREDAKRLAIDAMFKLEHGVQDVEKSKKVAPVLAQLQDVQGVWKDDYTANQFLRKKFREEKKEIQTQEAADADLIERGSLGIRLVPEKVDDIEYARKIRYHSEGYDAHRHQKRLEIKSRPLFDHLGSESRSGLIGKRRKIDSSFLSTSKDKSDNLGTFGILAKPRKPSTETIPARKTHSTTCNETNCTASTGYDNKDCSSPGQITVNTDSNAFTCSGYNQEATREYSSENHRLPTSSASSVDKSQSQSSGQSKSTSGPDGLDGTSCGPDGTSSGPDRTSSGLDRTLSGPDRTSCSMDCIKKDRLSDDGKSFHQNLKTVKPEENNDGIVITNQNKLTPGLLHLSYSDTSSAEGSDDNDVI